VVDLDVASFQANSKKTLAAADSRGLIREHIGGQPVTPVLIQRTGYCQPLGRLGKELSNDGSRRTEVGDKEMNRGWRSQEGRMEYCDNAMKIVHPRRNSLNLDASHAM